MLSICVLLFGEPREYKTCKIYFDEALQGHNVDYVGHAWNTVTSEPLNIHRAENTEKLQLKVQQYYNSSYIKVDDYKREFHLLSRPFESINHPITWSVKSGCGLNQWRSYEKATRILKNISQHKHYDLIICTRYDIAWKREIDIERIIDIVNRESQERCDRVLLTEMEPGYVMRHGVTMQDLLFFGSLNGVLQLGNNFTRNRLKHMSMQSTYKEISHTLNKTERKIYDKYVYIKNYRQFWGLQILESNITRKIINNFGKIRIARYGCPSYDFNTVENYERYFNYYKDPRNRKSIAEYNPEFKYT